MYFYQLPHSLSSSRLESHEGLKINPGAMWMGRGGEAEIGMGYFYYYK